MNFDNICIFHKHLRPTCDAEKKFVKKKITEANFSNLVSYLLYAYQKKSTEKLLAKSILWAKLDMRILQRLALKLNNYLINCKNYCPSYHWPLFLCETDITGKYTSL